MKARLLAVLLVSTLVLASAAPVAIAQAFAGENNTERQYVNCSQVQIAFGGQYAAQGQYAGADGDATAEIAEDLNISQSQVNDCLGGQPNEGDDNGDDDTEAKDTGADDAGADDLKSAEDEVLAGTVPKDTLPDTGGPSLFAAVFGVVLIVGGTALIRTGRGR